MIEKDTVRLLRECDAGLNMGVKSINTCLGYARDDKLKAALKECKRRHNGLSAEIRQMLHSVSDTGKGAKPLISCMSSIKTNMALTVNPTDKKVADVIWDGCSMGVKSLTKYLNQYSRASEEAKDVTKKLIKEEEELAEKMKGYL